MLVAIKIYITPLMADQTWDQIDLTEHPLSDDQSEIVTSESATEKIII